VRYEKKSMKVEAFQWTGQEDQTEIPLWICRELLERRAHPEDIFGLGRCLVFTKRGKTGMLAYPDDWIIQDANGVIYPISDETFKRNYEEIK